MRRRLLFLSFIPLITSCQLAVVRNNKPQTRIVVNQKAAVDMEAANLMQDFVKRISGVELAIIPSDSPIKKGDILIGDFQLPLKNLDISLIKQDGFFISTQDGYVRIVGGTGKGTIYGVVTLLAAPGRRSPLISA